MSDDAVLIETLPDTLGSLGYVLRLATHQNLRLVGEWAFLMSLLPLGEG